MWVIILFHYKIPSLRNCLLDTAMYVQISKFYVKIAIRGMPLNLHT